MDGGAGGAGCTDLLISSVPANPPKRIRFGEPQKFLPVAFVAFTICTLWGIYVIFHCVPLLQLGPWQPLRSADVDRDKRWRGIIEFIVFQYLTALLLICYVRSILVHPGEIPEDDPQWQYVPQDGRSASSIVPIGLQEMKRTGLRRHCKWCGKYKPDRCHHCRVCKTCILKMDHHCPWIYNCVGFANYKFFFLLLFYSVGDCHLIVWTMAESVQRCVNEPDSAFAVLFFTFFGETLALFLAVLLTMFFGFHIYLMFKAMTTIEFCEKSLPKKEGECGNRMYDSSVYDLGLFGNMRAVMGANVLLWFFPCSRPIGNGLTFVSEETRLTKEMESGKGIRRRTHRVARRNSDLGPYDPRL
uniref:Palmitoyltransferase n=1 Tax=Pyrodinium bahamense TaxID=73915 RepID=A0A7S0AMT5_9DINO|mmetsp:Transcript_38088/g.105976  ORF Transcript_38088/g.105976 Transcript_38088/m.105976 type:complete len:357 (+) Transcript_38088:173-1243(+)